MYIPTSFREDDRDTLLAFMRAHSFISLVSIVDGVPFASHIPVTVETRDDTVVLTGHVAKANAHARAFATALDEQDARDSVTPSLAIFTGPHAYVSPTVYEVRESVPTWNYIAVHAVGTPRAVHFAGSAPEIEAMLSRMIMQYDPVYHAQWDSLPAKFRDGMMHGLVAFEMPVERIEGKYKLSQNRSAHDQAAVATLLEGRDDPAERKLGSMMRERQ